MKFWHKAFLCLIVCFLVGFDIMAVLIVTRNYDMSRENELATAGTESVIISKSLGDRLNSVSELYAEFDPENIRQYVDPYARYYGGQGIYIALYQDGGFLYSSYPGDPPTHGGEGTVSFEDVDGAYYLLVSSRLDVDGRNIIFTYIKDEGKLTAYWSDISGYAAMTGTVISLVLSAALIAMLIGLTKPLRVLGKTAAEIAGGDYSRRAEVKGRDEIGEFAEAFNLMAENVEARIEELSRMTEEKQRFIDNLGHEMRTPVAAVAGYGELLRDADLDTEERLMAVGYIVSQSRRLQSLSAKLLELSAMKDGVINMREFSLQDTVENVRLTLLDYLEEKRINLETDISDGMLLGDPDLIESLIQNLAENAARAIQQGGKIKITAKSNDGKIVLAVQDDGPGMDEAELGRIFEPFYRADKSRSRANGGTGLGLSICRSICEAHNAELSVESKPGQGTKVVVVFQGYVGNGLDRSS